MLNVSYYTSRAGSLAVSQFPMITVLGTKNNILSCKQSFHVFTHRGTNSRTVRRHYWREL